MTWRRNAQWASPFEIWLEAASACMEEREKQLHNKMCWKERGRDCPGCRQLCTFWRIAGDPDHRAIHEQLLAKKLGLEVLENDESVIPLVIPLVEGNPIYSGLQEVMERR